MRLYPKKLRNIDDLERERKSLQKQARKLDKEELLSLEGFTGGGKKKPKEKEEERGGGSIVDMLPISNPIVSTLLSLLEKRLLNSKPSSKPKTAFIADVVSGKRKNILFTVAKEVIGGYLKWKAIELSYKGGKKIIKKLKQKKEDRIAARVSGEL